MCEKERVHMPFKEHSKEVYASAKNRTWAKGKDKTNKT
jgi:hypothetical protein